jgi:hypothetical protein
VISLGKRIHFLLEILHLFEQRHDVTRAKLLALRSPKFLERSELALSDHGSLHRVALGVIGPKILREGLDDLHREIERFVGHSLKIGVADRYCESNPVIR